MNTYSYDQLTLKKSSKPQTPPSTDDIGQLADLFRLMGDPSRLSIILACLDEPISVGDIAKQLGLSASLVSHHLRLLKAARVLRGDRRGKQMFYGVCDHHIQHVINDLLDHLQEPDSE